MLGTGGEEGRERPELSRRTKVRKKTGGEKKGFFSPGSIHRGEV